MLYEEIHELYCYCRKIGVEARIENMFDGYAIRFPNGGDFIQHSGSYGSKDGCVEPAIGSRKDYTAVSLDAAKRLVRLHKDLLNRGQKMANEKRLIELGEALRMIQNSREDCPETSIKGRAIWETAHKCALSCLTSCPTVDAVEVIRCKDCKHACVVPPPLVSNCIKGTLACTKTINWRAIEADHFCSYGERREGE